MIFVDTNYFLRFLLKDQETQHEKAKQLFADAAFGKVKLLTSTIVFFEIYWVLSSFYEKEKTEAVKVLSNILKMEFIELEEREILQKANDIFSTTDISLEDAYNIVYSKHMKVVGFKTFDKKLSNKYSSIINKRRLKD